MLVYYSGNSPESTLLLNSCSAGLCKYDFALQCFLKTITTRLDISDANMNKRTTAGKVWVAVAGLPETLPVLPTKCPHCLPSASVSGANVRSPHDCSKPQATQWLDPELLSYTISSLPQLSQADCMLSVEHALTAVQRASPRTSRTW